MQFWVEVIQIQNKVVLIKITQIKTMFFTLNIGSTYIFMFEYDPKEWTIFRLAEGVEAINIQVFSDSYSFFSMASLSPNTFP